MTREEAIFILRGKRDISGEKTAEALDIAIKAIEQESCDDCVSRKFMYELGATCIATRNENGKLVALGAIDNLPSVTPQEPRKGHWIPAGYYHAGAYEDIEYVKCSCCCEDSLVEGDYCPNCGAEMYAESEE